MRNYTEKEAKEKMLSAAASLVSLLRPSYLEYVRTGIQQDVHNTQVEFGALLEAVDALIESRCWRNKVQIVLGGAVEATPAEVEQWRAEFTPNSHIEITGTGLQYH